MYIASIYTLTLLKEKNILQYTEFKTFKHIYLHLSGPNNLPTTIQYTDTMQIHMYIYIYIYIQ